MASGLNRASAGKRRLTESPPSRNVAPKRSRSSSVTDDLSYQLELLAALPLDRPIFQETAERLISVCAANEERQETLVDVLTRRLKEDYGADEQRLDVARIHFQKEIDEHVLGKIGGRLTSVTELLGSIRTLLAIAQEIGILPVGPDVTIENFQGCFTDTSPKISNKELVDMPMEGVAAHAFSASTGNTALGRSKGPDKSQGVKPRPAVPDAERLGTLQEKDEGTEDEKFVQKETRGQQECSTFGSTVQADSSCDKSSKSQENASIGAVTPPQERAPQQKDSLHDSGVTDTAQHSSIREAESLSQSKETQKATDALLPPKEHALTGTTGSEMNLDSIDQLITEGARTATLVPSQSSNHSHDVTTKDARSHGNADKPAPAEISPTRYRNQNTPATPRRDALASPIPSPFLAAFGSQASPLGSVIEDIMKQRKVSTAGSRNSQIAEPRDASRASLRKGTETGNNASAPQTTAAAEEKPPSRYSADPMPLEKYPTAHEFGAPSQTNASDVSRREGLDSRPGTGWDHSAEKRSIPRSDTSDSRFVDWAASPPDDARRHHDMYRHSTPALRSERSLADRISGPLIPERQHTPPSSTFDPSRLSPAQLTCWFWFTRGHCGKHDDICKFKHALSHYVAEMKPAASCRNVPLKVYFKPTFEETRRATLDNSPWGTRAPAFEPSLAVTPTMIPKEFLYNEEGDDHVEGFGESETPIVDALWGTPPHQPPMTFELRHSIAATILHNIRTRKTRSPGVFVIRIYSERGVTQDYNLEGPGGLRSKLRGPLGNPSTRSQYSSGRVARILENILRPFVVANKRKFLDLPPHAFRSKT